MKRPRLGCPSQDVGDSGQDPLALPQPSWQRRHRPLTSRGLKCEALDCQCSTIGRGPASAVVGVRFCDQRAGHPVHNPSRVVRSGTPPGQAQVHARIAEVLQPQGVARTWKLAIEQGLRRLDVLNYAAEILDVMDPRQHARRHRRQPSPVDAAHGSQRVHPVPIPRERLTSVRRIRQASWAGPEFLGPPPGPACRSNHRLACQSRPASGCKPTPICTASPL